MSASVFFEGAKIVKSHGNGKANNALSAEKVLLIWLK
jgi:hypothetical protein